jgi:hypothetical protein
MKVLGQQTTRPGGYYIRMIKRRKGQVSFKKGVNKYGQDKRKYYFYHFWPDSDNPFFKCHD